MWKLRIFTIMLFLIVASCSNSNKDQDQTSSINDDLTPMEDVDTSRDTVFVKRRMSENGFVIDTLFIRGGSSTTQVLAGTTFLPYSNKMIGLLNKGLSPIRLEILQDCDKSVRPENYVNYPEFSDIRRDSNTLTIDVMVVANCCHNFLGEAEVIGQDTLNLVYTSYGDFCSCTCCVTLRYKFNTVMEENYQILKYVIINGIKREVGEIPNIN
ncbi:MAG: hypothetical protein IIA45_09270 [Bacteroidetes bacterium]|nr:hypothetical protein [Bacteroidota bacterium]